MSQVSIIIGREFNERVRKKSFIITTLLMPLLMIGLMFAPMLIMKYSRGDEKQIAVIDESGLVAPKLQSGEELVFQTTDLSTEAARKELTDKFGVLYIGSDILTNPNNVKLYVNSSSSLTVESNITGQLEEIIEAEKLKSYNIENLSQILQEVKTTVGMQTFRNDESQEEESQAKSSVIATGVGFVLGMILYMFLLIYGSMVMQSVIEEKNSRRRMARLFITRSSSTHHAAKSLSKRSLWRMSKLCAAGKISPLPTAPPSPLFCVSDVAIDCSPSE